LILSINLEYLLIILNNNQRTQKRPKLCLKNFDKEFLLLIQEKIDSLSLEQSSKDPMQIWYKFIVDCSLKTGAIIYDGLDNKKEYIKDKLIVSSLKKFNKKNKKVYNNPWWDKECAVLINKKKIGL